MFKLSAIFIVVVLCIGKIFIDVEIFFRLLLFLIMIIAILLIFQSNFLHNILSKKNVTEIIEQQFFINIFNDRYKIYALKLFPFIFAPIVAFSLYQSIIIKILPPKPNFIYVPSEYKKNNIDWIDPDSRFIRLLERPIAQRKIIQFINNKRKFLWWTFKGESGMGKSELALRITNAIKSKIVPCYICGGFDIGFYNGDRINLSNWRPRCNTILIIESAYVKQSNIREIINFFSRHNQKLKKKIRVLIITDSEDLFTHEEKNIILEDYRYSPVALELKGMDSTDQYLDFANKYKNFTKKRIHMDKEVFNEIIYLAGGNPKIFALLLDHYRKEKHKNKPITLETKKDILSYLSKHIFLKLIKSGIAKDCLKYFAISTIVDGLEWKYINFMCQDRIVVEKLFGEKSFNFLPSIKPRILGLYYVLEYLSSLTKPQLKSFIEEVTSTDFVSFGKFLYQTGKYFNFHPIYILLLSEIETNYMNVYIYSKIYELRDPYISKYKKTQCFSAIMNYKEFLISHKKYIKPFILYLQVATLEFHTYKTAPQLNKTIEVLVEIQNKYKNDVEVQENLAIAFANSIFSFFKINNIKGQKMAINLLSQLKLEYPQSIAIQKQYCRGRFSQIAFNQFVTITENIMAQEKIFKELTNQLNTEQSNNTNDIIIANLVNDLIKIRYYKILINKIHERNSKIETTVLKTCCPEESELLLKCLTTLIDIINNFHSIINKAFEEIINKTLKLISKEEGNSIENSISERINHQFIDNILQSNNMKYSHFLVYIINSKIFGEEIKVLFEELSFEQQKRVKSLLVDFQEVLDIHDEKLSKIAKLIVLFFKNKNSFETKYKPLLSKKMTVESFRKNDDRKVYDITHEFTNESINLMTNFKEIVLFFKDQCNFSINSQSLSPLEQTKKNWDNNIKPWLINELENLKSITNLLEILNNFKEKRKFDNFNTSTILYIAFVLVFLLMSIEKIIKFIRQLRC